MFLHPFLLEGACSVSQQSTGFGQWFKCCGSAVYINILSISLCKPVYIQLIVLQPSICCSWHKHLLSPADPNCLAHNVAYAECKSRLPSAQSGCYWAPVNSRATRERQSIPMNGQLFMKREQKDEAGGENALPQRTSVILTSLLQH